MTENGRNMVTFFGSSFTELLNKIGARNLTKRIIKCHGNPSNTLRHQSEPQSRPPDGAKQNSFVMITLDLGVCDFPFVHILYTLQTPLKITRLISDENNLSLICVCCLDLWFTPGMSHHCQGPG